MYMDLSQKNYIYTEKLIKIINFMDVKQETKHSAMDRNDEIKLNHTLAMVL